jgi:hypothetical protein
MGIINLVGQTLTGLIPLITLSLLDPVPGDEIAIIAGVLLLALGSGYVILDGIADVLQEHEGELVCMLYNSSSPQSAKADTVAAFAQFWVDDGGNSIAAYSASGLIASLLNPSVVNRLFTLETNRTLPEGDCSSCAEDTDILQIQDETTEFVDAGIPWGEEVTVNFNEYTVNGFWYSIIKIANAHSENPDDYVFTITSANLPNGGNCHTQYTGTGAYGPENWSEQGYLSWEFGCDNGGQTSVTGTFTKSG